MSEAHNQQGTPEERVLAAMRISERLTPEVVRGDVPQALLNEFADRLRQTVDPNDPIAQHNLFRDRAITTLYEARSRILARHNPHEFFQVSDHYRRALEKLGFKIEVHLLEHGNVRISVQERDTNGGWSETTVGNVALPALDASAGSTWEKDGSGGLKRVNHDIVALWESLWKNNVNNFGEIEGLHGPEAAARRDIEELKRMLTTSKAS